MHQHRIAGGMPKRVVDLLEAVEIDVQKSCSLTLDIECFDVLGQNFVEEAAIGQPGQRIVQRIELDARSGGLELCIACLRKASRTLEALAQLDVGRQIPIDADDSQ